MAHGLHIARRMTKAALVLALLAVPLTAWAQPPVSPTEPPDGATVASAQVSGFELGHLSPGLQDDIARIAGGPLDRKRLTELAARIEEEQPRYVAAVRVASVDGSVRVVFVVAHMRDQDQRGDANARYLIERVEIRGVGEGRVAAALNNDVQTLVGTPLGSEDVDKVEAKIKTAFPDYDVSRRVTRGDRSGEIRLLFILEQRESARWLRFTPKKTDMLYHSDQGWGALIDFPIGGRDFRVTPIVAIDHGDELIEEYSGFGVRVESRKLGTERLGASFEWTGFDQDWRDATFVALAANPTIPGAYENRSTITPLVTFAITRQLSIGGGVAITELEPLADMTASQMANAYIARVRFDTQWEQGAGDHIVDAQFTAGPPTRSLESDFSYNRYFGQVDYAYDAIAAHRDRLGTGRRHRRRGAALRALHARRFADVARLEQVRHRAGRRRSRVSHLDRVPLLRLRLVPRLRRRVGLRRRQARPRCRRIRFPQRPVLHDARLPAQHRRCESSVYDGCAFRRHHHAEVLKCDP